MGFTILMKQRLSYTDTKVLKTLGSWTDQTIHEHELVKYFSFKAARVSVLVVGSYLGYKRLYVYYFRWHKEDPPRPYRVELFDAAGRRVMTARLSDYRPVDVSALDDPPPVQPIMPTDIEITARRVPHAPLLIRRIHLRLSEMTAEDKWDRAACDFTPPAGVVPVQVDRRAGTGRAGKGTDP